MYYFFPTQLHIRHDYFSLWYVFLQQILFHSFETHDIKIVFCHVEYTIFLTLMEAVLMQNKEYEKSPFHIALEKDMEREV